jgi:hypothetical protein
LRIANDREARGIMRAGHSGSSWGGQTIFDSVPQN